MNKRIGIIGHGFVERAMEKLFAPKFDVAIYDVVSQPDPSKIVGAEFILICVPTPATDDGRCDITAVESAGVDAPLLKSVREANAKWQRR